MEGRMMNELDVSFLQYLPELVILNADCHPISPTPYDQLVSTEETLNKEISTLKIGQDSVDFGTNNNLNNTNIDNNNIHNIKNEFDTDINNFSSDNSHSLDNTSQTVKDSTSNNSSSSSVHNNINTPQQSPHISNNGNNNNGSSNGNGNKTVHNSITFSASTTNILSSTYSSPIIVAPPKPILRELILEDKLQRKRKKGKDKASNNNDKSKNKKNTTDSPPVDNRKRKDNWFTNFTFSPEQSVTSSNNSRVVPASVIAHVVQVKKTITASLDLLEKQIQELAKEVEDEEVESQQRFLGHVEMIHELVLKEFEASALKIRQKMQNELVCAAVAVPTGTDDNPSFTNDIETTVHSSQTDFESESNSAPPTPTSLAYIPLPDGTHDILIGEFDLSARETDMLFNLGGNDIFFYET
eukprot:TRINITY_DN5344_c0_g1_i2.p1 TRINITY_DN5344_c0_g1~~TRINITY_DN5344_c0_g1_i2.p1  ORF type:complete len:412 (-),score=88.81 TRINITY_DN5344_c0_g1_i2:309-1544(-)